MPKTATIRDVAQAAGVSKTTAVCVLNHTPHFRVPDQTRQKVQDAARRLGYRRNAVASALSRGRLHTLGIVCPLYTRHVFPTLNSVYTRAMIVAISDAAHRVGLRSTLVPLVDGKPLSIAEISDGRVDGVILVQVHDAELVRSLYESGLPCVAITAEHCPHSIRPDNRGGARQAVEHLISLRHRRIAHRSIRDGEAARERRTGFAEAVTEFGLEPSECPLCLSPESLLEVLQQPKEKRPTAVFAFNDAIAIEVLRTAVQIGLSVPQDLSLVGFDNDVLAIACEPQLTTIHNPMSELAEQAVRVLQALLDKEEPPEILPIPTQIVVRGSSAPPLTMPREEKQ